MAIKDLLIAFDGSDVSIDTLKYAIQLAQKHDAALTGVHVHLPIALEERFGRWVSQDVVASVRAAQAETLRAVQKVFEDHLQAAGFTGESEWFEEEGYPNEILADVARYYDILLMGQYSVEPARRRRLRAEELVRLSGKPIMIVPNGYAVRPFKEYAAVAWDGGRRAARALSDAMQILEMEERLDVVTVDGERAAGSGPGGRNIIRHLKRHGIDARHVVIPAGSEGVAATLLQFCRENEPDMLVMGAYGHARLREDLFGGVTQDIVQTSAIPVLIAR